MRGGGSSGGLDPMAAHESVELRQCPSVPVGKPDAQTSLGPETSKGWAASSGRGEGEWTSRALAEFSAHSGPMPDHIHSDPLGGGALH